jgi:hypothetical protein
VTFAALRHDGGSKHKHQSSDKMEILCVTMTKDRTVPKSDVLCQIRARSA